MKVCLFVTCVVDLLYPQVGVSTVRLLRRLGVDVHFAEDQTCCGQPAYNSGHAHEAARAAHHFVDVFRSYDYVVTPSGSCAAMVKNNYPRLLRDEHEDEQMTTRRVGDKTFELTEFIVNVLGYTTLPGRWPGRATYHASCHMSRGLAVRSEPIRLLSGIQGLELIDLPFSDTCCGFGGTFAVQMPELSVAMADEKINHIESTGAHTLIGSDMACLMHLKGRMEKRGIAIDVVHTAEVLEKATRTRFPIRANRSLHNGGM